MTELMDHWVGGGGGNLPDQGLILWLLFGTHFRDMRSPSDRKVLCTSADRILSDGLHTVYL